MQERCVYENDTFYHSGYLVTLFLEMSSSLDQLKYHLIKYFV